MVSTMIFNNKKGSTFVEAAVIMPLVILTVISVFYILINLYESVEIKGRLHSQICREAGYSSETFDFSPVNKEKFKIYSDKKQVKGNGIRMQSSGGLLKQPEEQTETGHNYIIVEEDIIRKADYVLP